MQPLLSVQDLSLDYSPSRQSTASVLQDVNFVIQHNEVIGLLGPSGSGKTSLLRCILGMPSPAARIRCAALRFEDSDLLSMPARARRILRHRRMGFIFQDPVSHLSPYRRVRSQLLDIFPHSASRSDLLEALRRVGFDLPARIAAAWPHQLSGGEAQRVAIAQALAAQPSLLLADEPSSALDALTQRRILDLLLQLRTEQQIAMLIVSHDPAVLAAIADRVLVLRAGSLAPYEPPRPQQRAARPRSSSTSSAPLLEVRDLRFAHVQHRFWSRTPRITSILHGISLRIAPGECLAIIGASGCGKSTLARCIVGIEPHCTGNILFNGEHLGVTRSCAAQAGIQLILQDTVGALNPRLTVAEILAEPLRIHPPRSTSPHKAHSIDVHIRAILAAVSFPAAYLSRFPFQLSGGERQRVAIARALILKPSLLLLDEALTGLDRDLQDSMLALLDALRREMQLTCIHFTHDLSRVLRSADRVAVLHHGSVVEDLPASAFAAEARHPASLQLLHAILPDPAAS
jgi:peptide/nickel transport system ATP-binding protein